VARKFSCDAIVRNGFPPDLLCTLRIIALRWSALQQQPALKFPDAQCSDIEAYAADPTACRCPLRSRDLPWLHLTPGQDVYFLSK
jgi:hypothetical protein